MDRKATLIFKNKGAVSVYEHRIAKSVDYKFITYKLRLPTFKIAKKFPNSLIEKSMQNSREKDVIAIVET